MYAYCGGGKGTFGATVATEFTVDGRPVTQADVDAAEAARVRSPEELAALKRLEVLAKGPAADAKRRSGTTLLLVGGVAVVFAVGLLFFTKR